MKVFQDGKQKTEDVKWKYKLFIEIIREFEKNKRDNKGGERNTSK